VACELAGQPLLHGQAVTPSDTLPFDSPELIANLPSEILLRQFSHERALLKLGEEDLNAIFQRRIFGDTRSTKMLQFTRKGIPNHNIGKCLKVVRAALDRANGDVRKRQVSVRPQFLNANYFVNAIGAVANIDHAWNH
jgi:hypothetical protein